MFPEEQSCLPARAIMIVRWQLNAAHQDKKTPRRLNLITTLKISRIVALFASIFMLAGIAMAPASHAGTPQGTMRQGTFQTVKSPITPAAAKLKTPGRGLRKQCDGKTTTQCCEGLSFCGCLYMPGSDDTHPTACFSNPPPAPKG